MIDIERESEIFKRRLDSNFYTAERAKNTGEDYVKSGKLDRDTRAVLAFTESKEFDIIKGLR